jgi:hypothetical protein
MALFTADFSVSGVNTAGTVLVNLKAGATYPITLLQVSIFYSVLSTTAYDIALRRMNAVGTGTITSTAGTGYVATGATPGTTTGAAVVETAWVTTRPTAIAMANIQRSVIPLTLGAGYIWQLAQLGAPGIIVPAAGGLCIYGVGASGATTGTLTGNMIWDE